MLGMGEGPMDLLSVSILASVLVVGRSAPAFCWAVFSRRPHVGEAEQQRHAAAAAERRRLLIITVSRGMECIITDHSIPTILLG